MTTASASLGMSSGRGHTEKEAKGRGKYVGLGRKEEAEVAREEDIGEMKLARLKVE